MRIRPCSRYYEKTKHEKHAPTKLADKSCEQNPYNEIDALIQANVGDNNGTLWARTTKDTDWSTGPLARRFARLLAPLTLLTPSLVGKWICSSSLRGKTRIALCFESRLFSNSTFFSWRRKVWRVLGAIQNFSHAISLFWANRGFPPFWRLKSACFYLWENSCLVYLFDFKFQWAMITLV